RAALRGPGAAGDRGQRGRAGAQLRRLAPAARPVPGRLPRHRPPAAEAARPRRLAVPPGGVPVAAVDHRRPHRAAHAARGAVRGGGHRPLPGAAQAQLPHPGRGADRVRVRGSAVVRRSPRRHGGRRAGRQGGPGGGGPARDPGGGRGPGPGPGGARRHPRRAVPGLQTGHAEGAGEEARPAGGMDREEARKKLLAVTGGDSATAERLLPFYGIIRADLRGLPVVIMPGELYVTESPLRKNTGTHYTPRSLAEEIVEGALEPLVYHPGPLQTADKSQWQPRSSQEILSLKVADIAMGSAAFLVAAARYLAGHLIDAWSREGDERARAYLASAGERVLD